MATQITNYQCPACMGPLHFVGESGRLECDYCGSNFNVAEIEALYKEKEQKAAKAAEDTEMCIRDRYSIPKRMMHRLQHSSRGRHKGD